MQTAANKRKIFNDPVHGFIAVPHPLIFDLIEHPYFQRLRRIKQLGLTNMVYPGALHTRFHHALGAMHLMCSALDTLRNKGQEISDEEYLGATVAILLHDIGHGPFSHALENSIVKGIHHEDLSMWFMHELNTEFNGQLTTGIAIFNNTYAKKFLHQLVSSQLDMDRLDYLSRDSYYSGVSEGVISAKRIIKMLTVANDELLVEEKGIYSIEKFIVSRRLMYWQVYLHKTVVSAEFLMVIALKRAKELAQQNVELFCSPALKCFLYNNYGANDFANNPSLLKTFALLDDDDVMGAVKVWQFHSDAVLSEICERMVNRRLFKTIIQKEAFDENKLIELKQRIAKAKNVNLNEADYFVINSLLENSAYDQQNLGIKLLLKNGTVVDVAEEADNLNLTALSKTVKKYFLCYPKEFSF